MSHYVFSFICNVWMLYKIEEKKKTKKWGKGVNCEEEMGEKKMRWVRGIVCMW